MTREHHPNEEYDESEQEVGEGSGDPVSRG